MALNYPGPYEVRIQYTVADRVHVQKLNCVVISSPDFVEDWSTKYFGNRGGTSTLMNTAVDTWVALMADLVNENLATIDYAELWKYQPGTNIAAYAGAYDISAPGEATIATAALTQAIFGFRTLEGNNMSIQIMEGVRLAGARVTYPNMNAQEQALVDHCLSNDMVWLARDTSFPLAFRHLLVGQNEALFKRLYR